MWESYAGHFAAVQTALCWSGSSLLFASAATRLGATRVNALRLAIAVVLHAFTFRLLTGHWWPDLAWGQAGYLAASGVVGLAIGDQALLLAFLHIGPRVASLIMTTAPIFAVVFAWFALSEALPPIALVGIAITIAGVAWVVLERSSANPSSLLPGARLRGVVCAIIGAACQAGGLLLSKQGIGHGWLDDSQHLDPQAATLVRMFFATIAMAPLLALRTLRSSPAKHRSAAAPDADPRSARTLFRAGLAFTLGGTLLGPYFGVWSSLIASDRAPVGVAQTLMELTPVFMLPLLVWFYGERLTARSVLGAFVAVGGCAMLFLVQSPAAPAPATRPAPAVASGDPGTRAFDVSPPVIPRPSPHLSFEETRCPPG